MYISQKHQSVVDVSCNLEKGVLKTKTEKIGHYLDPYLGLCFVLTKSYIKLCSGVLA